MGFFTDAEERPTAVDQAISELADNYETLSPTQRRDAMGLLKTVIEYSKKRDVEHIVEVLIPTVMQLLPNLGHGYAAEQLLVAIDRKPSVLRGDAMFTMGGDDEWRKQISDARTILDHASSVR